MGRLTKTIVFVVTVSTLVVLMFPAVAQIQKIDDATAGKMKVAKGADLAGKIVTIVNGLLVIAGIAVVVFIIIGGVQYVMSAGNQEKAEQAKKTILWAIIGAIVILLSAVIVRFVLSAIK